MNQVDRLRVPGEIQCPLAVPSDEQPTPVTLTDEQREALKGIGGELLPGSGFEKEEPEENFL